MIDDDDDDDDDMNMKTMLWENQQTKNNNIVKEMNISKQIRSGAVLLHRTKMVFLALLSIIHVVRV